ncbi:hypothetical protein RB598_009127 [Gaeumannomyces tritici]
MASAAAVQTGASTMAPADALLWRKLPVSLAELCIDTTLRCGQSFRWLKIQDEWHCSLHGRVVSLKQDETHLHYRATWPTSRQLKLSPAPLSPEAIKDEQEQDGEAESTPTTPPPEATAAADDDGTERLLLSYFNMSHSLAGLYAEWSGKDANFSRKAPKFGGVRILNQDAWETLVAFICSANNNIARISQMTHKLCDHYGGEPIATVAGHVFHDFPAPSALAADGVEQNLRLLGFGYRARYIAETARMVTGQLPHGWLRALRNPALPGWGSDGAEGQEQQKQRLVKTEQPDDDEVAAAAAAAAAVTPAEAPTYRAAHVALLSLSGVGPKVSDCVCLMGLGWGESVPIDTHMWTIATRDYGFGKKAPGGSGGSGKGAAMSKAMYDAVGEHFRALWGPQAGWAQSVLFTANLRVFSDRLKPEKGEGKGKGKSKGKGKDDDGDAVKTEIETKVKTELLVSTEQVTTKPRKRKARADAEVSSVKAEIISETTTLSVRRSKRIRSAA